MDIVALVVALVALVGVGLNWMRGSEQVKVNSAVNTRLDSMSARLSSVELKQNTPAYVERGLIGGGN